jgi:hypothetical protein
VKHKLLVIVTTFVCLMFPAWEEAAAGPLYCTMTGQAGSQTSTWTFAIPQLVQYGTVVGGPMSGFDATLNIAANGSVTLNNGFPVFVRWTEGPGANFPFVRNISATIGSNLQGTGTLIDNGPPGTTIGNVSFTINCIPANAVP